MKTKTKKETGHKQVPNVRVRVHTQILVNGKPAIKVSDRLAMTAHGEQIPLKASDLLTIV